MRTIIFILLLLSLYFGISVFIGIKYALMAFSLILILLATIFIVKKDFFIKYLEFVNPRFALLYSNKDDAFKRKLRITDIIILYVISAIMLSLASVMPTTVLPIQGSTLIYLIMATVLLSVLIWWFSLLFLKKSKKNSSFWFYFIGLIIIAINVFAVIEVFVL